MPIDMPNLKAQRAECKEDGGTWVNSSCPSGEKYTCIDDEDENEKDVLYKLYTDIITCGDLSLKNTDGIDIVSKGGACGPYIPNPRVPLSMCVEFPELSTGLIRLSCAGLKAPFINKCSNLSADLICYDTEEEMVYYFYGEAVSSLACKNFDMEEFVY